MEHGEILSVVMSAIPATFFYLVALVVNTWTAAASPVPRQTSWWSWCRGAQLACLASAGSGLFRQTPDGDSHRCKLAIVQAG
jgi:hypothetical protein